MNALNLVKTIRSKLFFVFFFSIVFLVVFGFILNTFFLEAFYISKNEQLFKDTAVDVGMAYSRNKNEVERYIEEYGKYNEINIEIVRKNGKIEYSSIAKRQFGDELPKEIEMFFSISKELMENTFIYETVTNDNRESLNAKIIFMSKLSNGRYLILSKPLKGVRESVHIMNQFTIITGSAIILIGGLITLIISKRATKPILEMNQIAQQISDLNFTNHFEVRSQDELGMLGCSINSISEKLNNSIEELNADIDRRKRLVRDISHELKTPISVIKGYSEGLKYGVAETPDMVEKYLETIITECDRMDYMVKEMIELSSYEYSEKRLDVDEIKVGLFFNTIRERFEPIFEEYSLDFKTVGNVNEAFIGDFNLIMRACSNFMTNAITHVDSRKLIVLNIEVTNNETHISVFNTGSNIPEDKLDRIWDVFYKIDEMRTRAGAYGSGIGLSIVKQIAVMHGGSVAVNNVREGVKFNLKIPGNFI